MRMMGHWESADLQFHPCSYCKLGFSKPDLEKIGLEEMNGQDLGIRFTHKRYNFHLENPQEWPIYKM